MKPCSFLWLVLPWSVGLAGSLAVAQPQGMVLIPGGEFEMGNHFSEGDPNELPVHSAHLDSFYLGIHEVTNRQYANALNWALAHQLLDVASGFVRGRGSSAVYCDTTSSSSLSQITWDGATFGSIAGREDHPMVRVSWYGAVAYANWRSTREGRNPCYDLSTWECNFDVNGYRLPTEAEWEYAARGGTHDPYHRYPWGNNIDGSNANYWDSGDSSETGDYPWTTPVGYYDGGQTPPGSSMPNGYGLYDMAGNVWEWCNDRYAADYYLTAPRHNAYGPDTGARRVRRGGSWYGRTRVLRCASRSGINPGHRVLSGGFRLALDSRDDDQETIRAVPAWSPLIVRLLMMALFGIFAGMPMFNARQPAA